MRSIALGLLARREHSAKELLQKLQARGYPETGVTRVIAALQEQGLQSDVRYTEAYVHSRVNKGYGPLRILRELERRGIEEAMARKYLYHGALDWRQLIEAARRKKFGDGEARDYQEQSRQSRFLQYRGFSGSQIQHCLRRTEA